MKQRNVGPWLVVGGAAVAIGVGFWLVTRSGSAAPPVQTRDLGPPYIPPPPAADFQITAGQQSSASMKVGQTLAIAQPRPAAFGQNWGVIISPPPHGGGPITFQDAAVQDLGWQTDYTDHVTPTAQGSSTVTMILYESATGAALEGHSIAISAS